MSKGSIASKKAMRDELWRRGELSFLCHPVQKEMRDIYYGSKNHSILVWLLSRQTGKCLEENTLVATPTGPVKIKDLVPGDIVYGFNRDGSVSETEVLAVEAQGKKEVVDLMHRGRIVASSTEDHRWSVMNTFTKKFEDLTTREILQSKHKKINRRYIDNVGGDIHEPHAYSIGAMLGDGYCKMNNNQLSISSIDDKIPSAVSKELGCFYYRNSLKNFNWTLSSSYRPGPGNRAIPLSLNHYDWMKNKKAHEKICDLNVIKTWDRDSQIRFLAGLIDTDGSIFVTGRRDNELKLQLGMQAKVVVDAVKHIILSLFQIEMCEAVDDRKKYVNGAVHTIYTNNNFCVKRILKAIDPYLVSPQKKYKPEYDSFPDYNHKEDYCGVIAGGKRIVETYDIQVNNDTNLYLLANGLVTHNSSLLTILALEAAYREKNSIIKIITDTKVHAKTIFVPIFNQFLETCPDEIKPKYMAAEYCYVFENGSRIELAGSDGQHYEKLRGQRSSAVFIDEAGFCSELDVMVNSVLLPTTTHTGGKLVLSSTPPKEFTHPFLNFMERAELEGLLTKKTIDDNPLLTKEQISIIEKQMGGRNSEQFRREYLCHVIKLSTDSALPEVTDELLKNIVKEWQRPPFKDNYMAMDLGFNDLTAVLFGYYDFAKDKIIIEDELPFDYKIKNNTTKVLTSKIQEKEQEIWTNPHTNEISYPVSRVSDINHIVTKDIFENSNKTLYFTAPKKEEKTAMVSSLRILLASEKIIIHPRCENLIRHLKNVKWAKNGKEFARSVDNSHYDFVDALIYLVRSINFKKNPYPLGYGLNLREDNAHIPVNNSTYRGGNVDAFKAIMGMRKR